MIGLAVYGARRPLRNRARCHVRS